MAELLNNRLSGLRNQVGGTLPGSLPKQAQALQASNTMNLQNQIASSAAAGQQATAGQVQGTGAQQTAAQAKTATDAVAQGLQTGLQQGQQALQLQEGQRKNQLASKSLQLDKDSNELASRLDQVQRGLKNELFDKQLTFQQDELGRTAWNDRQLMDYQLTKAQSEEDLKAFEQNFNYYSNLKMQVLKASQAKITEAMQQASQVREFDKNSALQTQLAQAKADLDKKIAKEKAAQSNRASMFNAAFTVAGAAIGAFGGPAGSIAGGAVGGAIGNVVASQTK